MKETHTKKGDREHKKREKEKGIKIMERLIRIYIGEGK